MSSSPSSIVERATASDINECLALDRLLNEGRREAADRGFLLTSSDTLETYKNYLELGAFWVARNNGRVVGFLFAIPPGSNRMEQIVLSKNKFQLVPGQEHVWDQQPLAWLAKVGIEPEFMGRGIASTLYKNLFGSYPDWNFLTTTVKAPLPNLPSRRLQERFGFVQIGTLPLGDRGVLKSVECDVFFRAASA